MKQRYEVKLSLLTEVSQVRFLAHQFIRIQLTTALLSTLQRDH